MSRKNLPNPATCTEAARRFTEASNGGAVSYADRSRMRELALVIGAFGDAPVPAPIIERWDWSQIGD